MIRGVLFDMDGLMFDTEALGLKGWKAGRTENRNRNHRRYDCVFQRAWKQ